MPTLNVFAFQMYGRCIRLSKSSEILIRAHQAEEALFLGRSLFEDSLRLNDLAVATNADRASLLLGFAIASMNEGRGLAHVAVDAGVEQSPDALLAAFDGELAKLQRHAARNGSIKPRKFRSVRDAAHAHGRQESLWTYSLAHEMVHGNDLSFLFNRRRVRQDAVAVHLQRPDFDLEIGVSCFCAESALHAAIAFAQIFTAQKTELLQDQLRTIADLQDQLVAKRSSEDAMHLPTDRSEK